MTIAADEADWRFDRWCKKHFPHLAFGQMQRLLRTGQFRLDGRRLDAAARLQPGQVVRIPPLPVADGEAAGPAVKAPRTVSTADAKFIRSLVLYEDEHLIAIDKPAGLAVQGGSKTYRHVDGMLDAFVGRDGQRPRLVHRLDRDTSGILVLARSGSAARELVFAFQQHRVRKLYWAVLVGAPTRNEGRIDLPLAKAGPSGRERMEVDPEEGGQFARTSFKILARAGKVGAWVALQPHTGRTHQLRAHMNAIGTPILGDGKYGGKVAHPDGAPKGLMLHARELELPHPTKGRLLIEAPPPLDFRQALNWLGLGEPELPGATLAEWPTEGR
ncbi:23S rRNA pseudouridine955/2504/2580 synthase [Arboricoccus pini]|uniref:Pseudouridine synthase n=2 Tax=Arboricoccus pini TaxID=1963835 RepID=A0A212QPN0_9PROT|nr:23S rRNA pseudouridine955/2504/2580 synthase [Arboricoccus pini]